jgi:predicted aldo/keto reductase-like oxidoreductase
MEGSKVKYNLITDKYKVSCVGIGGHYSKMEEGSFEARYAKVSLQEIKDRAALIEKAVAAGINYFDTTWRNEVEMLGKSIEGLQIRDRIFVNGMVLGAFKGSAATGMEVCDYFNHWLDERLPLIPEHRFDSFMINAIDEDYDEAKCEKLVELLEKRKQDGDFKVYGFSSHDHNLARKVADRFPEFKIIMTAYNFRNRKLEQAFDDYKGDAAFIAMKPLVWAEYGIPFCALNNLPDAGEVLGIQPIDNIAALGVKYIAAKDFITSVVCAINGEKELDSLIEAGLGNYKEQDELALSAYNEAQTIEKSIPLFISALYGDPVNSRMRFFAVINLAKSLQVAIPEISLNMDNSDEILSRLAEKLILEAQRKGYGKYTHK